MTVLSGKKKPLIYRVVCFFFFTKIVYINVSLEHYAVPLEVHTNTTAIHAIIVFFRLKVDVNRQFP